MLVPLKTLRRLHSACKQDESLQNMNSRVMMCIVFSYVCLSCLEL